MKTRLQTIPLRLINGGECLPRISYRAGSSPRRFVPGGGGIATWLYDVVDRRAREIFETLQMGGGGGESRCA